MFYKPYQHVLKYGTVETDGILNGEVNLFYKIDGTNSCVFLDENNELTFGSRRSVLNDKEDQTGFYRMMKGNNALREKLLKYLTKHPDRVIYGEFLIPVTIKRYKSDAWRQFYIFDIVHLDENFDYNKLYALNPDTNKMELDLKYIRVHEVYEKYDDYSKELDELGLLYIPRIAKLTNPTIDEVKSYLDKTGDYLIQDGLGEGILIKNYDYKNVYGRTTWAKILTEDFLKSKKGLREGNHEKKESDMSHEYNIVKKFLTVEHVSKERSKFIEVNGEIKGKNIPLFLNYVYHEWLHDNIDEIIKTTLKTNPSINFKYLEHCLYDVIKSVVSFK